MAGSGNPRARLLTAAVMGVQGAVLGLFVGKEVSFNRLKTLPTEFGHNMAQYDLTFLSNRGFEDVKKQLDSFQSEQRTNWL